MQNDFELIHLFSLPKDVMRNILTSAVSSNHLSEAGSSFSELPVKVLFHPGDFYDGSLHLMHFPPDKMQGMHHHSGNRCLLILSDTDLHIKYSRNNICDSPLLDCELAVVPKYTICIVRFRALLWHMFSSLPSEGIGAIAFSFHEKDDMNSDAANSPDLMSLLTTYYPGAR